MRILLWAFVIIGSIVGGFFLLEALTGTASAPQQGALAAIAVSWAVLPYVIARAVDRIVEISHEPALEDDGSPSWDDKMRARDKKRAAQRELEADTNAVDSAHA